MVGDKVYFGDNVGREDKANLVFIGETSVDNLRISVFYL